MKYRCEFSKDERGRTKCSLMLKGERISGLAIWHMPMRVGSAHVLMGGIGGVWTHEAHRKKGHATVVMEDSVKWMREHRFDMSVLFGIPNFYHRWGFITTMSSSRVFLPTRVAETCDATCRPRKCREADLAAAMEMYNDNHASRSGSIVRDRTWTPWRKGLRWGVKPTVFSYAKGGKLAAVAAFDLSPEEVNCVDAAATDPRDFAGVIRHAAEMAVERRVEKITFWAPPDGAFADFCRETGACEMIQNTPRRAGGMARIINQAQCLKRVAPELTRRLRASAFVRWTGAIDLATDLGTTRLVVTNGKVAVGEKGRRAAVTLRCRQERLTQLLLGFQSIDFLLAHRFAKVAGNGRDLAAALFPTGTPWMAVPDHF